MPAKPKPTSLRAKSQPVLGALVAFCVAAFGAPVAHAADARYEGISEAGDVAVFSTTDKLVSGDTDLQSDVYVRDVEEGLGFVTREVSLGPTGGNDAFAAQFLAVDPDGETVFFATKERLTASDNDKVEDVYARDLVENETLLVSAGDPSCAGSGCGNAGFEASAAPGGIVDGGAKVFFLSAERLSSDDLDSSTDIYMRDLQEDETELVSVETPTCAGSCGSGTKPIVFQGAAADGSRAIFTTAESLAVADQDEVSDLYERDLSGPGETKLVSVPGSGVEPCPTVGCEPATARISADGSHVFFETSERISAADEDEAQDVYDWTSGTPVRASNGPGGGNEDANAKYAGSSADGTRLFFETQEALDSADTDSGMDVYVRISAASTDLVSERDASCFPALCGAGSSPAALAWGSPDGTSAVFSSDESLTVADEDESFDVYARDLIGGSTALVSLPGPTCLDPVCGNEEVDASFAGASPDAARFYFHTAEALAPPATGEPSAPGDRDEQTDVYVRGGGTTALVSAGQLSGSGPYSGNAPFNTFFQAASVDGAKVFLLTAEQLTAEDSDVTDDIYMRAGGGTLLVSRSNDAELEAALAPPGPQLLGTDPESPNASTSPNVYGVESVESSIKIYSTSNCTGAPVGTGSAETLEEPGIAVEVGLGTTTNFRATAEANGFVSACSGELSYTQKGVVSGGGSTAASAKKAPEPGPLIRIPHLVPQTRITFGPAFKTRARRPVFRFTDETGQTDTSFECKLDRGRWKPCGSPTKLKKLDRGRHAFAVLGVNADGVAEEHPVKRKFKVVPR